MSAPKAVFVRIGSRPIPRVTRMMRVAVDLGYETVFCGAFREEGLQRSEHVSGYNIVRLGRYFPLLNGRRPLLYLKSVIGFNRALYRFLKSQRPTLIHASDIETMPAAAWYRLRQGGRLIYNIHDNLSQRYRAPRGVAYLLNVVEGLFVRRADVALVPEGFRRSALPAWCRENVVVVRNTVEDPGFAGPADPGGQIRVFFGGWLDWGRGLAALLHLADENADIRVTLAGEGSPEIIDEIRKHSRVNYLGFISHENLMEETRRSHFVSALYDPSRPINRFAASNKVAEALSVGRPVIINSEMRIAENLAGEKCAVVIDYDDAAELAQTLRILADDSAAYRAACNAARRVYESEYAWEPVRQRIEAVLVGDMA